MKLKEFDILLDIKRNRKVEEFEVVQGDYESNILNIAIVEDFEPYDLTGLNVEIAFAKPDGTTVLQDEQNGVTIITEGKIRCILNTNTIAASGKVFAEVRILQDLRLLTTARFDFFVRRAIVNDETIESTNEFPILNRKIQEVNDLVEEIQSKPTIKGDPGPQGEVGKSLEFAWSGTELGVRLEGQTEYQCVNLKGAKGDPGNDAEVTKENVETALGYTPANNDDLLRVEYSELSSIATNIDEEGIYRNIEWKRKDSTLYAKSTLLGTTPNYNQIKIDYYNNLGTTIDKTITWNLAYDDNGFIYKKDVI